MESWFHIIERSCVIHQRLNLEMIGVYAHLLRLTNTILQERDSTFVVEDHEVLVFCKWLLAVMVSNYDMKLKTCVWHLFWIILFLIDTCIRWWLIFINDRRLVKKYWKKQQQMGSRHGDKWVSKAVSFPPNKILKSFSHSQLNNSILSLRLFEWTIIDIYI